ncbi:MAG: cupin domain-containing protein, partial [Cystobacter sp.]
MIDPLAEVVSLLQPRAPFSKLASGAGRWRVSRAESGRPFFCAILEGVCRLAVDGHEPMTLEQGDFVLIPSAFNFTASSLEPPRGTRDSALVVLPTGEIRHGDSSGPPEVRMLVG